VLADGLKGRPGVGLLGPSGISCHSLGYVERDSLGETYSSPVVTIFTFTRTPSLRGPTSIPKWAGPQTFPVNRFFRGFLVGFQLFCAFLFPFFYFLLHFRFSFIF
jgi:hypothetical protein